MFKRISVRKKWLEEVKHIYYFCREKVKEWTEELLTNTNVTIGNLINTDDKTAKVGLIEPKNP